MTRFIKLLSCHTWEGKVTYPEYLKSRIEIPGKLSLGSFVQLSE